jgi:hypothetical protein
VGSGAVSQKGRGCRLAGLGYFSAGVATGVDN